MAYLLRPCAFPTPYDAARPHIDKLSEIHHEQATTRPLWTSQKKRRLLEAKLLSPTRRSRATFSLSFSATSVRLPYVIQALGGSKQRGGHYNKTVSIYRKSTDKVASRVHRRTHTAQMGVAAVSAIRGLPLLLAAGTTFPD